MKLFLFALESAALQIALSAQTNQVSSTNVPPPPPAAVVSNAPVQKDILMRAATEIFSDSGDFDLKSRVAVYTGNVRVVDPQMKLTCDVLTASVPEGSGRVDHIVAERNVVIDAVDNKGEPVHATGQKAIYTYKIENSVTNETVELTGDPRVEMSQRVATGDSIIWDRINNSIHGTRLHMISTLPDHASTNRPGATVTNTPTP